MFLSIINSSCGWRYIAQPEWPASAVPGAGTSPLLIIIIIITPDSRWLLRPTSVHARFQELTLVSAIVTGRRRWNNLPLHRTRDSELTPLESAACWRRAPVLEQATSPPHTPFWTDSLGVPLLAKDSHLFWNNLPLHLTRYSALTPLESSARWRRALVLLTTTSPSNCCTSLLTYSSPCSTVLPVFQFPKFLL